MGATAQQVRALHPGSLTAAPVDVRSQCAAVRGRPTCPHTEGDTRLHLPRRWATRLLLVLLTAMLCAGPAALLSLLVPPRYAATAQLVASAGAPDEPAPERAAADQVYARTFAELLGSMAVAERVTTRLPYSTAPDEATQQTTFTAVDGTAVVEVTARGPDPRRAADLATTWATVSAEEGAALVGVRDATLTLASPAPVPSTPERPRPLLYSSIAAAAGASLAALVLLSSTRRREAEESGPGLAQVTPPDRLSPRRSRSPALVQSRPSWLAAGSAVLATAAAVVATRTAGLPGPVAARILAGLLLGTLVGALLAVVALLVYDRARDLVVLGADAARATGADVIVQTTEPRRLRAARGIDMRFRDLEPYRLLYQVLAGRPETVVVVVDGSAGARSGLRSIDVAVAGANAGARTVLVGTSAQGHRRGASDVLGRALREDGALERELVATDRPHLRVLPLVWPDASDRRGRAALASRQLPLLVDRLLSQADFVVVSSPSLREPEVSLRLAEVADAALLVVVAGETTVRECRQAADRLARAGSRVVGVVLVHRGSRHPAPAVWTRPPKNAPDNHPPPPDDSRPAGDPKEATTLAGALRRAGAGSGRARGAPALQPAETSTNVPCTASEGSPRHPSERET